jgi:hypothetical protein
VPVVDHVEYDRGPLYSDTIHPYLGYVTTPGIGMEEKSYPVTRDRLKFQVGPGPDPWWFALKANNWGFWSPHSMPYRKKPNDFVVVLLGGSVGQWLGLQGEATLKQELKKQAPLVADRNIVVLNCALSGFKQPQQVLVLTYLMSQGVLPDAVVNIDGFNEAAIGTYNVQSDVAPEYPRADLWPFMLSGVGYSNRVLEMLAAQFREKEKLADMAGKAARWSRVSNVLGIIYMNRARRAEAAEQVLHSRLQQAIGEDIPVFREFAARGPATDLPEDQRIDEVVRLWIDGSLTLSTICRGRGIPYLHVLQPSLHDTASRPSKQRTPMEEQIAATRSGTWGVWADSVREIYPVLRKRASVLESAGVAFEDLSYLFEPITNTIYYDICHYNQQGNEMVARSIATRLAEQLAATNSSVVATPP